MQMEVHPLLSNHDRLTGMWGWCRVSGDLDGKAYLDCGERNAYARLTSPKRRREWLAARMIVKEIMVRASLIASFQECSVQKDVYGCPRILIHGELAENRHCTIAHKNGLALAAVSFENALFLGVDLESLTDKPLLLREAFSTGADFIAGAYNLREKYCILWSCKEAVSKALGKGMTMDFKKIIINGTSQETYQARGDKSFRILGRYAAGKECVFSICHLFPAREPGYKIHFPAFQRASRMALMGRRQRASEQKDCPQRKKRPLPG